MSLDETGPSGSSSDFDLTTPRRDEALDTSKRFFPAQPESQPAAQTPPWGAKRCPSCHTPVLHNQTVCAECGTRLIPRLAKVRCLRCRKRATSDHVICPHCGRELRAAPSRLLTIGAPALLVGALAIALLARDMPSFLQENDNLPLIQNVVITPVSSDAEPSVRLARDSLAPAVVQSGAGQSADAALASSQPVVARPAPPTQAPTTAAAGPPAQAPAPPPDTAIQTTETSAANATQPAGAPAETVVAPAETSTSTPTAAPTPTPAWMIYTIKKNDMLQQIAQRFQIDLSRLMEENEIAPGEARRLQVGQEIELPGILRETATPAATETATPGPTPAG